MKIYRLRGKATDKIRGAVGFYGAVAINDARSGATAKRVFTTRLRADSDVEITRVQFEEVEEVKGGFLFVARV
jgi:hypothetical protein